MDTTVNSYIYTHGGMITKIINQLEILALRGSYEGDINHRTLITHFRGLTQEITNLQKKNSQLTEDVAALKFTVGKLRGEKKILNGIIEELERDL